MTFAFLRRLYFGHAGLVLRSSRHSRFWKRAAVLTLGGLCSFLGSCASSMLLSEKPEEPGLIYYLPKTILALTITAFGNRVLRDGVTEAEADGADARDLLLNVREIRLTDAKPVQIADHARSYSLKYDSSIVSLDRVCMGLNSEGASQGLLTTVEGAADDKTGDVIVSVAKLAGRALGGSNGRAFANAKLDSAALQYDVPLQSITVEIDPVNRDHWEQVNRAMRLAFGPVARDYRFSIEDIEHITAGEHTLNTCPNNSVCYRSRSPVRLMLKSGRGLTSSFYRDVINQRVTGNIDVSRAFMVEKITRLKFDNGVLTGVVIKKPSEGLAVAKLPLTVLDAVATSALAAPAEFFSKFSGPPNASMTSLLTKNAEDAANIKLLQDRLRDIRNGDLSTDNPDAQISNTAYQLKCNAFPKT